MKAGRAVVGVVLLAAAAGGGWWIGARGGPPAASSPASADGVCPDGRAPRYWKAPMDATYIRDRPGKSPMGMDLVPECGAAAGGDVRIDPGLVQNMGVRTAPATRRNLSHKVRTVARVAYDERRVSHVHTKVQGWIERLFVEYEGDLVERGQPLLEIYSPEMVSTQEELLLAARYRETTRRSRFADVARGGADLFQAARRRLELWDIAEHDIARLLESGHVSKTLTLYAPTNGVVTHLMAREGMEIAPNHNLYTIADISRVWLYADVYEYEMPWVREGQHAVIELSYLPGRTFEGTVTYVSPFLNPKTRTASVRIELDNPDLMLKPDMFANVTIETETRAHVLAVPEEAVIRSGRRALVVVARGAGRFASREVTLGIDSGDGWVEVRDGLTEGERIVTSGQFLIDSESKLREAVQKMMAGAEHDHADHAAPAALHAGHAPAGSPDAGMDAHSDHTGSDAHAGHAMTPHAAHAPADAHAGHGVMDHSRAPGGQE